MTADARTAARLRDLEMMMVEMANNAAELARQIEFVNPGHGPTLELMANEMSAIAARLAEPRTSTAPLAQIIRRTFDEWMASAETVEAWASRLERAIAGRGAPLPATVDQIMRLIAKHGPDAAPMIAALFPAPAVPAEIVERAKEIMSRPITDPHLWNIRVADCQALTREIAACPAPAPDPVVVEAQAELSAIATIVLSADVDYPGGCALVPGRLVELVRHLAHRAELTAPAPDPEAVAWQPIESCPNETDVLLWWPLCHRRAVIGRRVDEYMGGPVITTWRSDVCISGGSGPVAWMPLPAHPAAAFVRRAAGEPGV